MLIVPCADLIQNPRVHRDSRSETSPTPYFLGLDDGQRVIEHASQPDPGLSITCSATDLLSLKS